MKVEIWSDIACPFCYIGKRRFEKALEKFPHKDEVEVVWKSFQLDPTSKYVPGKNIHEVLASKKGWSVDYAKEAGEHVSQMAANSGLHFDMDKVVPANTFDGHRLIHLAAHFDLQDEAKEKLLLAYFTEGKNIEDQDTLRAIGLAIGLPSKELNDMLASKVYTDEVRQDIQEAQQLGVRGVPFFVYNRKYAVSGAQEPKSFEQVLQQSWEEWRTDNPAPLVNKGDASAEACDIDGSNC